MTETSWTVSEFDLGDIAHYMFIGGQWAGYRLARAFTVDETRYVKHATVALVAKPAEGTPGENKINRYPENVLWELREGDTDTVKGLVDSVKLRDGYWRIIDRVLWPFHSIQYKTATFAAPVELKSDKVYFFVLRMEDESGNADVYPVWCGTDSTTTDWSYHHCLDAGWTQMNAAIDLWLVIPGDQAGVKYHAVVDGRGYMSPDKLVSYNSKLATQFGATLRGGQSRHSQISYPYSSFSQDTFRHGMGWTYYEDPQTFYFGYDADVRVEGQVILSPRTLPAPLDGILVYHLSDERADIGLPWRLKTPDPHRPVRTIAQQVWVEWSAYHTVQGVWLWVRREWMQNRVERTLTFQLCLDADGEPGEVLREVDITATTSMKWHDMALVKIEFAEHMLPEEGQYLWLVLTVSDIGTNEGPMFIVSADPTASFSIPGKTTKFMYQHGELWVDASTEFDLQFFVNMGAFPVGDAFFAEHNGELFVAAGHSVYLWEEDNKKWYVKRDGHEYGGDVTGLVSFGGYLWAAWGDIHDVERTQNGKDWETVTGERAGRYFIGKGYLWKSDPRDGHIHKVYRSNDGEVWSAEILVGTPDMGITGFCLFNDVVVVSKENGLWYVDRDDFAHNYFDYQDQKYERNGVNLKVWSNNIYIPILSGLWRWTGATVDAIGPDRGTGMPRHFEGHIRDLVSCANWLFAAVDAGSTGWSQILCYNGIGWLPFIRAQHFGSPIRSLFITSEIGNELRLWFMEEKSCYYVALPYTRENHFEWEDAKYQPNATLVTSWWNGGLFNAVKYFKNITLEIDGLVQDELAQYLTWVDIWYQIDGTENILGPLHYLGRITADSEQTISFGSDLAAYSIRFIFKLGSLNANHTPRIKSYNVDCIVRPDSSYVTSFAVSLADNVRLMDGSQSPYTAEELWNFLKVAQARAYPIVISLPWGTIYGFISALQTRTQQFKEMGEPTWEQMALISIVEA